MLTVQAVDRLGRNLLEGLLMLNELFQKGYAVRVLEGIAKGDHTERSPILDLAFALAEDRRREIAKETNKGLEAARKHGRIGGRRPVMSEALTAQAVALRDKRIHHPADSVAPHLQDRYQGDPVTRLLVPSLRLSRRTTKASAETPPPQPLRAPYSAPGAYGVLSCSDVSTAVSARS